MNPDPNQPAGQPLVPTPIATPAPVDDAAAPSTEPVPATSEPATSTPAPNQFGDATVAPQADNPFFSANGTAPVADTNASVNPAVPVAPIASTPTLGGAPSAKKINKKLLLIIAGGVVLLLVIVAVLIYFLYFNITKADYQKAVTAGSSLAPLELKSRGSLAAITGSNTNQPVFLTSDEAAKAVTAAKDDFTAYQTAVKNYDQQKALHDGAVGKVYKDFKTKFDAYQTYTLAYTKSIDTTLGAVITCNTAFKQKSDSPTYDNYKKQSDECRAAMVSAQNTEDPDWKSYIASYIAFLDDSAPVYKNIYDGIAANDYNGVVAKFKELKPATLKFTDASKALATSISDRFKATEGSASSFTTVTDLLAKKANQ